MAEIHSEEGGQKYILRKKGAFKPRQKTGEEVAEEYAIMQGVSGEEFEQMFFGEKINWRRIAEKYGVDITAYMDPKKCIQFITEHYPENRTIIPEKKVSRDLYDVVAEGLGIDLDTVDLEYLQNHLRFYSSLYTSLDYYNGVDGFFEYIDPKGHHIYCALDTTQNPYKAEYKADLKVMGFPDYKKHMDDYLKWLDFMGKKVVYVLQTKRPDWI
ncbi:hypothetical protein JW977_01145 [Candidatus Falkowbacteria bacterium]|nr:hypothetical protein [Candidatus Falkowbacteria bacterium]